MYIKYWLKKDYPSVQWRCMKWVLSRSEHHESPDTLVMSASFPSSAMSKAALKDYVGSNIRQRLSTRHGWTYEFSCINAQTQTISFLLHLGNALGIRQWMHNLIIMQVLIIIIKKHMWVCLNMWVPENCYYQL